MARAGRKESASASGMPGASPAAAAGALTAARSRRPPVSMTVAKGGSSAGSAPGAGPTRAVLFSWRNRSIGQCGRKRYMTRRIGDLHLPARRHAAATPAAIPPASAAGRPVPEAFLGPAPSQPSPAGGGGREGAKSREGSAVIRQRVSAALRPLALGRRLGAGTPAAQQQGGDAGALGGELQAAAGDHRQAADLADHRGEPAAGPPRNPSSTAHRRSSSRGAVTSTRRAGSRPCACRPGP